MITLLNFAEIAEFLPFIMVPVIFLVVFAVIIIAVVKRANAEKRRREIDRQNSQMTDGNGRTEHQRDYLASLRVQQSERKAKQHEQKQKELSTHAHSGKAEHYEPIVGSLGEVDDEGCDELDGIRLVEHDESYCDDPDHIAQADMSELQKAIVLGEVLNNPRFVNPYKKK